ncbi:MAG: YHS domain-containing protein [Bacteroidia bacterium]
MKTYNIKAVLLVGALFLYLSSCDIAKKTASTVPLVDLVCGLQVDKSEAYKYKYAGVVYYFDTYNCKEVFIRSPEKFIKNQCVKAY